MLPSEGLIVSVSGIIIGMVARELPSIIMEKVLMRKNHSKPEQSNGTRLQLRDDVKDVFIDTLKQDVLPVLNQQTSILEKIAETNSQMKDGILILVDRGKRGR